MEIFPNPYKPGAGHQPPYLAGRTDETAEFDRLLAQDSILENLVLTGLRGVGKTVLLETFKPRAQTAGWGWVGTDLSESVSISEANLAMRLLTDLSVLTSGMQLTAPPTSGVGFAPMSAPGAIVSLTYEVLSDHYERTPGLVVDKLKSTLEWVWSLLKTVGRERLIFAYDEAQTLSDYRARDQFPLSTMLDVFQSLQRKGVPFMLVLTGLPTLFPKLVEARTYAERMFRVVTLDRLTPDESELAVTKPIEDAGKACPVRLTADSVTNIVQMSGGYPYFIQFICREVYDLFLQQITSGGGPGLVPTDAIQRKLDTDFFAGRWARATDRQRHLLWVIAHLDKPDQEFTIQEVVAKSKALLAKSFSASHVNQILASLSDQGLIYKNRFGRYSYAVPLLAAFILRTFEPGDGVLAL